MSLVELKSTIDKRKGKREQITSDIQRYEIVIQDSTKHLKDLEKARSIVQLVAQQTQEQLRFHISDIASLALESIFPDPYKLLLEFITNRNKTECNILFSRDGDEIDPKTASGGGAIDVAAFALRIASWSMTKPRTRNVMVLDEPMKWVSAEYREAASEMIKQLSDKLSIQFIINTHDPVLATYADRIFKTSIKNKVTKIKQL